MEPLFDRRSLEQKIEDASTLLKSHGYRVQSPPLKSRNVRMLKDLVRFFYDNMERHHPDSRFICSPSMKRDLGIAKRFVESREATGISKRRALAECCEIIETLFRFEEDIGLNNPATSMAILGNGNMAWVTEKAIQICNKQNNDIKERNNEAYFEQLSKKQSLQTLTEEEHEKLLTDLDNLAGRDGTNGKTKKEK